MNSSRIRALVVDDSAFVRKVVREMLSRSPEIEVVGAARDGEEALTMVGELQPDVVTCDLSMPRLDGVGFVRRQMAARPLPILILTASPQDGAQAVEALNAGAVDLVRKPTALATNDLLSIRDELVGKVTALAGGRGGEFPRGADLLPPLAATEAAPRPGLVRRRPGQPAFDVLLIGISTGGPQALRRMLPRFPADFPVPIAIVLHMPVGYTALYAEKLNEICALEVKEAAEGDEFRPGRALLAPAGRHLLLRRTLAGTVAQLSLQPLEKIHRPSVDVLFRSAAERFQDRVLGVVMTGMGDDGREGAAWLKAHGATVLTEAESSCVIYGMPRSVVEAGLSDAAVPLDALPQAIFERL